MTIIHQIKQLPKLLRHVQQSYVADGCRNSAAALTYMTLFAIVPLMTVMYAILSAVPAFQQVGNQIQELVFNNFVPSSGQEIQSYLQEFSSQARKLTGVGVAFLGVTAVLMLKNIEKTFNDIWHTRDNRSGLSSFLLYWAILSLGPLFIGLALGISTYLVSLRVMFDQVDVIGIGPTLLRGAPYLLTSAAFTLIFAAIPNCKVPIKNAAIGGFVTALAFELAKQLFTTVVSNTSFQVVYGTFAAIPLFLLWVYLSWLIVLAGAELVNALGGFSTRSKKDYSDLTLTLGILEKLWSNHKTGTLLDERELLFKPWLFEKHSISSERWTTIRNQLMNNGYLQISDNGLYLLGKDLHQLTLWNVIEQLQLSYKTVSSTSPLPHWFEQCQQHLTEASDYNQKILSISLAELFDNKDQKKIST